MASKANKRHSLAGSFRCVVSRWKPRDFKEAKSVSIVYRFLGGFLLSSYNKILLREFCRVQRR